MRSKYNVPEQEPPIAVPRFSEANGFYTTPERSAQMSKIRGRKTKPEMTLRKALWHCGLRYQTNTKDLPGKPDISIKKYKLAIFVDGEFWHGYDWEQQQHRVRNNQAFWMAKIARNMQRDRQVNRQLVAKNFTILRFWEHEIKKNLGHCVAQVLAHVEDVQQFGIKK